MDFVKQQLQKMSMQTSTFIVPINQWDIVIKCVAFNDKFI